MAIEVIPTGRRIGAEIRGVNFRQSLDAAELSALREAWKNHLVLILRGQPMSDDEHIEFTRIFGVPQESPLSEVDRYKGARSEIAVISNIIENGVAIGSLGAGEAHWHSDSTSEETPPDASLLRALEIPPHGGNTHFANMYLAYDTLPEDLKRAIEGRTAIHDATYTSAGALRKGKQEVADVTQAPGARHPLVRTHPETKKRALYLGRRLNSYIVGMPVAESEELLDRLWSHATQDDFTYSHQWRIDDLVMWDNRCALHRRDAFDPTLRRRMHRTQIMGSKPV